MANCPKCGFSMLPGKSLCDACAGKGQEKVTNSNQQLIADALRAYGKLDVQFCLGCGYNGYMGVVDEKLQWIYIVYPLFSLTISLFLLILAMNDPSNLFYWAVFILSLGFGAITTKRALSPEPISWFCPQCKQTLVARS